MPPLTLWGQKGGEPGREEGGEQGREGMGGRRGRREGEEERQGIEGRRGTREKGERNKGGRESWDRGVCAYIPACSHDIEQSYITHIHMLSSICVTHYKSETQKGNKWWIHDNMAFRKAVVVIHKPQT